MEYFGTNTTEHGHYRWTFAENIMMKMWAKFDDLPFHPEELTRNLPKGETAFYQGGGFSVLAISGSCVDSRPGTKSVFWVNEIISKADMVRRIMEIELAMEIIKSLPFEVKLNLNPDEL